MHSFLIGSVWNFFNSVRETFRSIYLNLSQTFHLNAFTHIFSVGEFILSTSHWDGHHLAEETVRTSESTGTHLAQPAWVDLRLGSISEHKSATGFPHFLCSLTLSLMPSGAPSLTFKTYFSLGSNQISAVFHIFQQPSSIQFVPDNLLVNAVGMEK